jgi:hypothetical protein
MGHSLAHGYFKPFHFQISFGYLIFEYEDLRTEDLIIVNCLDLFSKLCFSSYQYLNPEKS